MTDIVLDLHTSQYIEIKQRFLLKLPALVFISIKRVSRVVASFQKTGVTRLVLATSPGQAKSKAPRTHASNLTSLELFLAYITGQKCHPKLLPPLSPGLQVTFAQLIPALQGWRASTDSFSQHSQLQKYIADCDTLITNEDNRNLCTSKPYVEGARIIQEAEKGTQLSIMQFTLARDH